MKTNRDRLSPIFPGEILLEEFLIPLKISQNKLSRSIDVPLTRVNDIIHGKRGISADTALRLARYFNTSAELWLGLQAEYDIRIVLEKKGNSIDKKIIPYKKEILL